MQHSRQLQHGQRFTSIMVILIGLMLMGFSSSRAQAEIPIPLETTRADIHRLTVDLQTNDLLTNGGFEIDGNGDNIPDGWTGKRLDLAKTDRIKCNKPNKSVANSGNCAFQFKGNADGARSKLMQTLDDLTALTDNKLMVLSTFVDPRSASAGTTVAKVKVKFSDGSKLKLSLTIPADGARAGYILLTDSKRLDIPTGAVITKVKVELTYAGNSGSFRIDDVSLRVDAQDVPDDIWQPAPGTTWQWQLTDTINTSYDVQMYDIDLFETPQNVIDQLHADGRIVICYFSAGSYENWRPDAESFPDVVLGNDLDGWPGERWLDIRRMDLLAPLMQARLQLAADKDCDGVEPDNIDGYINNTGFSLTGEHQLAYNRWLAASAHGLGLSIGLKNDLDQVTQLVNDFDWALNEQCFQYDECDLLLPFIDADKAVFGVEYTEEGLAREDYCPTANAHGFSWLTKTYDLGDLPPNACQGYPPRQPAQR